MKNQNKIMLLKSLLVNLVVVVVKLIFERGNRWREYDPAHNKKPPQVLASGGFFKFWGFIKENQEETDENQRC